MKGELIKEWDCISDACRALNVDSGSVTKVCQGKCRYAKGYIWRYEQCHVNPIYEKIAKILQFDKDDNLVREWDNARDAAISVGCDTSKINMCLRGKSKTCKGFVWKWKDPGYEEMYKQYKNR